MRKSQTIGKIEFTPQQDSVWNCVLIFFLINADHTWGRCTGRPQKKGRAENNRILFAKKKYIFFKV